MTYEITTTAGKIDIVHGLDTNSFIPSNLLMVARMGNFIVLSSDVFRGYRIDFGEEVVLNGVTQTNISSFFTAMMAMATPETVTITFTNADLVANVLTSNHGLNATVASHHIWDGSGIEVTGQYTPVKVTNNQDTIDFGDVIVGTWTLTTRKES